MQLTQQFLNQERHHQKLTHLAYEDPNSGSYPYATLFVLFMSGQHRVGLQFCQAYCSKALSQLYQAYRAHSIKESQVDQYWKQIENEEQAVLNDPYYHLLSRMMVGSVYRKDDEFRFMCLFENLEIQLWMFLRLASFRFAPNNDQIFTG